MTTKTRSCRRSPSARRGGRLQRVVARGELAAQQLADRRFRDFRDKDVAARPLEIGKPGVTAERIELFGFDRGAALDEGGNDLAPALFGQSDQGDFRGGDMQRWAGLNFDRRYVFAAGDDHIVDSAGDEDVAVAVDKAGVAGEVPALAERLGIRIGTAPIAVEGFVAGEER